MSEDTGGLVLTPPARNYSPWYQWMTRLAATTHEDPLPEGDPAAMPAWVARRRARLSELLGPEPEEVPLDLETLESEALRRISPGEDRLRHRGHHVGPRVPPGP